MVTTRRLLATLALALVLVTAGCSGAGSGGGDAAVAQDRSSGGTALAEKTAGGADVSADYAAQATGTPGAGSRGETDLQARQQAIIRTGRVSMEVSDFTAARENVTAAVESYGGYVADSHREVNRVNNETYVTGRLVLRVPSENFSQTMSRLEAEGDVRQSSTSTQDVTDQLVDINARLQNLRAQRDQLRQLYQEANDTEDVLAVHKRLSEVQTEIERLEARKQSLEQRVAYSTISVEMREPRPDTRVAPDHWYDTPVLSAFLQSVDGVVVALRALVVAFAYALPYLVVFLGPLVVLLLVILRRRRILSGLGR
jgi:hypothetical protein